MNKPIIKYISILILALIFMYAFSGSYVSSNIDNIAYVIAMGIDLAEDEKNLQVTFQFMDTSSFSSDGSSQNSSPIVDTVTTSSISSAINLLDVYIGKRVNLSHCKVFVFCEKLASKGITAEVTDLMNNIQVRPSANIIVSKGPAIDYIKNSTSSLEKVLTKYYDIFPNSSEYTGYTSNITIGKFYNNLINIHSGNVAILGGINKSGASSEDSSSESSSSSENKSSGGNSSGGDSSGESSSGGSENSSEPKPEANSVPPTEMVGDKSSITGERGTENVGLAVFKQGKYIGDLTAIETLCHSLLINEVDSFLLTVEDSNIAESYIDISFFENTSNQVSVDISGDVPTINIIINLKGRVFAINDDDIKTSKNIDLDKISKSANEYLKKTMLDYLNKTSTEYKCDIDNFYDFAKQKFLTVQDWENFNWSTKYEQANFNVTINSNIFSSLLSSD